MRFHSRRILTFGLSVCFGIIVIINIYNIDSWTGNSNSQPWNSQSQFGIAEGGHFDHGPLESIKERIEFPKRVALMKRKTRQNVNGEANVWPNKEDPDDDRIVTQMKYIPKSLRKVNASEQHGSKVILISTGLSGWAVKPGQETFLEQKCPVNRCFVTANRDFEDTADVLLFKQVVQNLPSPRRPPHQVWVLYLLESPYHTPSLTGCKNVFNWTATYRHDSTIVAPYEKFVQHNNSMSAKVQTKNYAEGKTKQVAWFVSNCGARNGRQVYAHELAKYIDVDIYGVCGPLKCPRLQGNNCFELLNKNYKFYLAFENSNCVDYITEKFFLNGLQNDIIPIVMGARPEDYQRASPPHSYIHVEDFESPKQLAEYLHLLDQNDKLYNEYFQWKGTGEFVNTYFWCRLCALAHDKDHPPSAYEDIEEWWRGEGVCIGSERWDHFKKRKNII